MAAAGAYPPALPCMRGMWNPFIFRPPVSPVPVCSCSSRASLVPVFSFGENDLFPQFPNPPGSWVPRMQEALQRILSVALPLFHGRLGLLIPFRVPIHTVGESRMFLPSSPSWEDCSLKARHPSSLVHAPGTYASSWPRTLSRQIPRLMRHLNNQSFPLMFLPQWAPGFQCSEARGPAGNRWTSCTSYT